MKKEYIIPEFYIIEMDGDGVMGNQFSDPKTDKPEDVPIEPITPPVNEDDEGEPTAKRGGRFEWNW